MAFSDEGHAQAQAAVPSIAEDDSAGETHAELRDLEDPSADQSIAGSMSESLVEKPAPAASSALKWVLGAAVVGGLAFWAYTKANEGSKAQTK